MALKKPSQIKDIVEAFDYSESELVIALVYAVGTDYKPVQQSIEETLKVHGYAPHTIRISDLIGSLTDYPLEDNSEVNRISSRMNAGNAACRDSGRRDLWALAAIAEVNKVRGDDVSRQEPLPRAAHLVLSLKRPEEVSTLRKVYNEGFFLVGVFATEKERLDNLIEKNAPKQAAIDLIKRDEEEVSNDDGQKTRETFQLADVFVQLKQGAFRAELSRFFQLVFSDPYITPTQQEHAMFLAYASSLRSGQLGRQVGAAITSKKGDVLAVGCNDVPQPGGGLYWPGASDNRDHIVGIDTNDAQRNKIVEQLIGKLPDTVDTSNRNALKKSFRSVLDITEYGRAVHAEMDALLTCARSGVSPIGAILYTTTFPCHNCTRHIIAVGIERVIYIEPYAKSRAEELHEDAIVVEEKALRPSRRSKWRVPFTHFVGIGPRRYFDLFSLNLSSGHELERKENGQKLTINPGESWPRIPLSPLTYIQRERLAIAELDSLPKQLDIFQPEE
jgi:deoxycytidylate deaminase